MSNLRFVKPLMIFLGILACGVVIGMLLQQAIFQSTLMKVADNLDGVKVDINLNESKLIEGFKEITDEMMEEINKEDFIFNDSEKISFSNNVNIQYAQGEKK